MADSPPSNLQGSFVCSQLQTDPTTGTNSCTLWRQQDTPALTEQLNDLFWAQVAIGFAFYLSAWLLAGLTGAMVNSLRRAMLNRS